MSTQRHIKMLPLRLVAAVSLLQAATAQDPNGSIQIVHLVNPLWALPNGENSTNGLGASVVNVDSTAITYAVSCDATAELVQGPTPISCIWETVGPQIFTQWNTSLHFTLSTTGFGDVASYEGDYTFPSTLAPTITGSFSLSIAESQVTRSGQTIPAQTSTTLQTGTTEATWYRIPITAGEEKLLATWSSLTVTLPTGRPSGRPSLTATSTLISTASQGTGTGVSSGSDGGSGIPSTGATSSPTITSIETTGSATEGGGVASTGPSTSSSAAAGEKAAGKVGWVGAMVGGVLGIFFL
ncbi:hypothetical protein BKA65DRAFT_33880 [Rhexocercosporidium sp. MPI-PUGE-AT-0058]|nr:hypothetical protein BKA65DRAFT_33880 [Rhexocercosporidium sp. MPI-PUGE-AT-0058]